MSERADWHALPVQALTDRFGSAATLGECLLVC